MLALEQQLKFNYHRPAASIGTVKNIILEFASRLFWHKKYVFKLENIVQLFNALSKSKYAPKETYG